MLAQSSVSPHTRSSQRVPWVKPARGLPVAATTCLGQAARWKPWCHVPAVAISAAAVATHDLCVARRPLCRLGQAQVVPTGQGRWQPLQQVHRLRQRVHGCLLACRVLCTNAPAMLPCVCLSLSTLQSLSCAKDECSGAQVRSLHVLTAGLPCLRRRRPGACPRQAQRPHTCSAAQGNHVYALLGGVHTDNVVSSPHLLQAIGSSTASPLPNNPHDRFALLAFCLRDVLPSGATGSDSSLAEQRGKLRRAVTELRGAALLPMANLSYVELARRCVFYCTTSLQHTRGQQYTGSQICMAHRPASGRYLATQRQVDLAGRRLAGAFVAPELVPQLPKLFTSALALSEIGVKEFSLQELAGLMPQVRLWKHQQHLWTCSASHVRTLPAHRSCHATGTVQPTCNGAV